MSPMRGVNLAGGGETIEAGPGRTRAGDRTHQTARSTQLFEEQLAEIGRRRDRVFAWLFVAQWVCAIFVALVWSPYAWQGKVRSTNLHVYYAVIFGGFLTIPSLLLIRARPGSVISRQVIAVVQMLWSALFIHLSGGRIETHFHIFGSLAFLAFYRDWRVILTATLVVGVEHLMRGLLWSESVYGITNPEWWRFAEHVGWVLFEDVVLVLGILEALAALRALADRQAELESVNDMVERKVIERTNQLSASREQYRLLVETTRTLPYEIDTEARCFRYVGPQVKDMLGIEPADCLTPQFLVEHLHPEDREQALEGLFGAHSQPDRQLEFRLRRADGTYLWARLIATVTDDPTGTTRLLRGIALDITQTRELETQLRQAQKLESVGRLASGVAHEINTPVQFVGDSVQYVREAFSDLASLIAKYQELRARVVEGVAGSPASNLAEALTRAEDLADLPYLLESVPEALGRSAEGLARIAEIVRSLKVFAHPDKKQMTSVDLNQAILGTLVIARNEYKLVASVETHLGELPPVVCFAGEVNQVFLNIIVNAAHAIEDVVKETHQKGLIIVRSYVEGEAVVIAISDTGGGIPESIRDRVFDPFFTTKEVGKGTGQGLAIARSVVVDKHGGLLKLESEIGQGTTFRISLPIAGKARTLGAATATATATAS